MELGPDQGTVKVRTGVAGSASRMGHRLVLVVQDWAADVDLQDGRPVAVTFRAGLDSLQVESGKGGVTPLTVVDKQVIRRNAGKVLDVDEYPQAVFESTSVSVAGDSIEVSGELTIRGVTLPLDATLSLRDSRVQASIPVIQTDFGIRPYSAMLGQLKVSDEVMVDLDVTVPA
jgi:polyisoprenoid-binding protein YceI